jgi:hypothetical protein
MVAVDGGRKQWRLTEAMSGGSERLQEAVVGWSQDVLLIVFSRINY